MPTPLNTTPAILLRRTRLTETSLIVAWLTRDSGRIRTVAKAARRPRSPFAGKLDLFFHCEIQIARSRKSDLHTLREVMLVNPFPAIRTTHAATALAGYFVELIELATEPDHPMPEIYDLMLRAFHHLDTHAASRRALLHFEAELARLLGLHGGHSPSESLSHAFGKLPASRAKLPSLPDRADQG